MTQPYRFRTPQSYDTNGPYISDLAIVGPPVGRATRPPAGPTAGNPGYSLETKGRWYELRPFNLPNPESAGKISYRSSLLPVVS